MLNNTQVLGYSLYYQLSYNQMLNYNIAAIVRILARQALNVTNGGGFP